jgi:hypothetical protein
MAETGCTGLDTRTMMQPTQILQSGTALFSELKFVFVSGSPLGPMTRIYIYFFPFDNYFVVLLRAPSLTKGRLRNLQCNR